MIVPEGVPDPALGLPDVAVPRPLGGTLLALALPHRAAALGTLPPATRTPPQETHRLGPPDDPATAPLAAPPPPGAGGRQQLRRPGPAPLRPIVGSTRYPHRPLAPGRRPLCASATPRKPGQNGRPPLKGRRLPALKTLLDLPTASAAWYDGTTRTVELTSQTAVWYRSGKPPVPLRWVLVRDPQGECTPQALLCTGLAVEPVQILEWFVLRRQLEVTFQEVRTHLGVDTQHQWSDQAIARTTPILMGLFSWTTLAAHLLRQQRSSAHRTAAGYAKPSPTFVDALALVRCHLRLASEGFSLSAADPDLRKIPTALYHRRIDSLVYAA